MHPYWNCCELDFRFLHFSIVLNFISLFQRGHFLGSFRRWFRRNRFWPQRSTTRSMVVELKQCMGAEVYGCWSSVWVLYSITQSSRGRLLVHWRLSFRSWRKITSQGVYVPVVKYYMKCTRSATGSEAEVKLCSWLEDWNWGRLRAEVKTIWRLSKLWFTLEKR